MVSNARFEDIYRYFVGDFKNPIYKRLSKDKRIVSLGTRFVLALQVAPENAARVQERYASLPYAFRVAYQGDPQWEILKSKRSEPFKQDVLNNPPEHIIQIQKDPEVLGISVERILYIGVPQGDCEALAKEFETFVPYRFRVHPATPAMQC